jgi:hypothetical protein
MIRKEAGMNLERRIYELLHAGPTDALRHEVFLRLFIDRGYDDAERPKIIFSSMVTEDEKATPDQIARSVESVLIFVGKDGVRDLLQEFDTAFSNFRPYNVSSSGRMSYAFKTGVILGLLNFAAREVEYVGADVAAQLPICDLVMSIAIRCGGMQEGWQKEDVGQLSNAITRYYDAKAANACQRYRALTVALAGLPALMEKCQRNVSYKLGYEKPFTEPVLRMLAYVIWHQVGVESKIKMLATLAQSS